MEPKERQRLEKEESSARRRQQILEAGKKVFAEKSPGEVTMASIARECGLSTGTIYLYYESKEDLLFHIMTDFIVRYTSTFRQLHEGTGLENLTKVIEGMKADYHRNMMEKSLFAHFDFFYVDEYPDLPIVKEFETGAQELNTILAKIIGAGQKDGSIRQDIDPRLYGCLIGNLSASFGGRTSLRREILTRNQKVDPYEEFCLVLDLILGALKPV